MNPTQPSTSYPSPPQHHHHHNNNNNNNNNNNSNNNSKPYSPHHHHQQAYSYPNIPRASHLHLPGVNTYIEHYHYYNFNGNCTVQQASGDGQPNTIHMAPPPTRHPHYSSHSAFDVPPVPPPMSNPFHSRSHSQPYAREPVLHHSSLPNAHLAPLSIVSPHLTKPPPSTLPDTSQVRPPQQTSRLPRLRTADSDPPILAPLQPSVPSSLSPLHPDDNLSNRPSKRSRLSHPPVTIPLAPQPVNATPVPTSDTNCQTPPHDRPLVIPRGPTYHNTDRHVNATNSSSPSQSEYQFTARIEPFERTTAPAGSIRPTRNADESQSNDWEAVVEMYTTGKGTEDGVALKMITKGDGRRVSDRKLLEKRRTIGKTYECLGVERFERAIGYKWENGVRRKQKMYHVISRCRVVNAMRKAGEPIPTDCDELTRLINGRIAEKEALKAGMVRRNNVASAGLPGGRIGVGGGGGGPGSGIGYSLEDVGRIRSTGTSLRESSGSGLVGELGGLHGGRTEKDDDGGGRARSGHGRSHGANGDGILRGRDEDEIRPGRAQDGGRYA